jgi:hypothetical protein
MPHAAPAHAAQEGEETIEALRARYDELLAADMTLQTDYSDINRWRVEKDISPRLRTRAGLLRQIERFPTLEESFPALRQFVDKNGVDAEEVLRLFAAGTVSPEDARAAGQLLSTPDDLSDEEYEAFIAGCEERARANGYEVLDGDADLLNGDDESALVLRKDGLTFNVALTLAPSQDNIVPGSRISSLVTRRPLKMPKMLRNRVSVAIGQESAFIDGRWPSVARDEKTQREVDRVVALFS